MNILYYMEPHPIRNMFTNFNGTIGHLINLFFDMDNSVNKVYIYSNKTALDKIAITYPDLKKNLIYPTNEDEIFFGSCLKDWESEGINDWINLMKYPNSRYFDIIKRVCKEYDIEIIVHWATNATVSAVAKDLKIGYVDMELGCCRAPYMQTLAADPRGVNGASVLSNANISDLSCVKSIYSSIYDLQYSSGNEGAVLKGYEYITNNSLLSILDDYEKIAFIPLQLYDDANLLIYSPYQSPKEALMDVLPMLSENGYFCVIKEHPLSKRRGGLSLKANIDAKKYASRFNNVLWVDDKIKDVENAFYYKISDLVVTVNSSVGFEALFYDKPCVVLGEAVYKVGGMYPTLNEFFNASFDIEKYKYYASQVRSFFLRSYLLDEKRLKYDYFMRKIKFISSLSKLKISNKQIIEAYYNYEG